MDKDEFLATLAEHEKFNPSVTIKVDDKDLMFLVPNQTALWRAETLYTKEPCTIAWLNNIPKNAVFLDIGANIGMYSLYAAVVKKAQVYAFEPESQNYSLLNKNIFTNNVSKRVRAFCGAISDKDGLDSLYLSNFALGSSCHSLGEEVGFDLEPRKSPFAQGAISFSIDTLVEKGLIPLPEFVKIDVDGFEHKVLEGARNTLSNEKVQSVIIELNPHLQEHIGAVNLLKELGFEYSQGQVNAAARSDGAFKDVGEWIFYRKKEGQHAIHILTPPVVHTTDKSKQLTNSILDRIRNTNIKESPFPHMIVDNIFPEEYYQRIQENFPAFEQMKTINDSYRASGYAERFKTSFAEKDFERLTHSQQNFWGELGGWLYSPEFINGVIDTFWPYVKDRLEEVPKPLGSTRISADALLVNDQANYTIGPHTDMPQRLITFLFYLPKSDSYNHLGTSFYEPDVPGYTCPEGHHYTDENFSKIETVDFIPNRLLLFVRTNSSFHGVEKVIDKEFERHLLINNIRLIDG